MDTNELNKLIPDELVAMSESDTSTFRYDRYHLYEIALKKYLSADNLQAAENMKREVMALQLSTHSAARRFSPMWETESEDGTNVGFPDLDRDFSDIIINYYRERTKESQNPILQARYSDIIWEKERDHIYGRSAVRSYLSCWPLYLENGWDRELADSLSRALSISLMLNDQSLVDLCIQEHINAIEKLVGERMWPWISNIIGSVVDNSNKYSKQIDYDDLLNKCELAIKGITEDQIEGFYFQRNVLQIMANIFKNQKDEKQMLQMRIKIAESYVEEGDWKKVNYPSGNLVAAKFYASALQEYMDIPGCEKEVDELKMKIAEVNRVGITTELKPISVEIEIPIEPLKKHVEHYEKRSVEEMLTMMSMDKNLLPSWERAVGASGNALKDNALLSIMPMAVMKGNIQIKNITGDQATLEFHAIQNFQMTYRTISIRLIGMIFELIEAKTIDFSNDLVLFMERSKIISSERLEIIRSGLKTYQTGDYIAAFHVLIFQIEGVLRDFLAKLGLPTFSYRKQKDEMRERQLDDILRTLSQEKDFDKDLSKFLEIFLCRIEADNYRNEAAHGLLTGEAFTRENCQFLILSLIKLVPYSVSMDVKTV